MTPDEIQMLRDLRARWRDFAPMSHIRKFIRDIENRGDMAKLSPGQIKMLRESWRRYCRKSA